MKKPPIHGLYYRHIEAIEDDGIHLWSVLHENDHLLRRFGYAQIIRSDGTSTVNMRLRQVADEFWALVEGSVEFIWHDLRQNSPTFDQRFQLVCEQPTLLLAPFGVAFGQRVLQSPVTFLRISTHEDGEHAGDKVYPLRE